MDSSNKRIAKNTAFMYIRMFVMMMISLYTSRVILSTLGATDYGIYNVVGGIVTIMSFLNGALSSSTSRFLNFYMGKGDNSGLNKVFSASLNLHLCVALLVIIFGETLGLWLLNEKLVIPPDRMTAAMWVYQFSIITTAISFTQVPYSASLVAHENMSIYAFVGIYEAISKLVISYLIIVSPIDSLVFYALLLLLNNAAIQFYYRWYTYKKYTECRFRVVRDKTLYKTLAGYSGWDLFGNVAVICQDQGINILLNLFFGPIVNAARAIALQFQNVVLNFTNNIVVAVRPQVVKNYAGNKCEEMYRLTFTTAKYTFMLVLFLVIPAIFEIDYILYIWLGDNVPAGTNYFVIIILLRTLTQAWGSSQLMAYHAIGRIRTGNIVGGSLMISALPLSYIALKMGAPAYIVYWIIFATNFLSLCSGMYLIHSYVPFNFKEVFKSYYFPCIIVFGLSILIPIAIKYCIDEGFMRLLAQILLGDGITLLLIIFVGLKTEERKFVFAFINKKLKI